jgi:chemotaxis protein MotA
MDIATLIGLIFGLAVIGIAIATGGDVGLFVNLPGILIVLGGTLAATLIKFRLVDMISAFALGMRTAFREVASDPNKIYKDVLEMAAAARAKQEAA